MPNVPNRSNGRRIDRRAEEGSPTVSIPKITPELLAQAQREAEAAAAATAARPRPAPKSAEQTQWDLDRAAAQAAAQAAARRSRAERRAAVTPRADTAAALQELPQARPQAPAPTPAPAPEETSAAPAPDDDAAAARTGFLARFFGGRSARARSQKPSRPAPKAPARPAQPSQPVTPPAPPVPTPSASAPPAAQPAADTARPTAVPRPRTIQRTPAAPSTPTLPATPAPSAAPARTEAPRAETSRRSDTVTLSFTSSAVMRTTAAQTAPAAPAPAAAAAAPAARRPGYARAEAALFQSIHDDHLWLNNPVMVRGLGLAPVIVATVSGRTALMLCAAALLLLTATRVLTVALCHLLGGRQRPLLYIFAAAVVYIPAYVILFQIFGNDLTALGIYLPLLVADPVIIKHMEAPELESVGEALARGINNTLGLCVSLLLVGVLRELLGAGSVFGRTLLGYPPLPLATQPAGGFLLVGLLAAFWTAIGGAYVRYKREEVRHLYGAKH